MPNSMHVVSMYIGDEWEVWVYAACAVSTLIVS